MFIFANQAGLDMLETTLVALQDVTLDKILNDSGCKGLFSEFSKIMQQVVWLCYTHRHTCHCIWKWLEMASLIILRSPVTCLLQPLPQYPYKLQGYAYLPGGICMSTMGRQASYDQAIIWKVMEEEGNNVNCLALSFVNWSFMWRRFSLRLEVSSVVEGMYFRLKISDFGRQDMDFGREFKFSNV